MSKRRFLNAYELGEITRRHELAKDGNPLRDLDVLNAMYDSLDDIPKLLAEVNRLHGRIGRLLQILQSEGYIADHVELKEEGRINDED